MKFDKVSSGLIILLILTSAIQPAIASERNGITGNSPDEKKPITSKGNLSTNEGFVSPTFNDSGDGPPDEIILNEIASIESIPVERLILGSLAKKHYPVTGFTFYRAKAVDITTGQVYILDVDENANTLDTGAAQAAEAVARDTPTGRLDAALKRSLEKMARNEKITIAIWLKTADADLDFMSIPDISNDPSSDDNSDGRSIQGSIPESLHEQEKEPIEETPTVSVDEQAQERDQNAALRGEAYSLLASQMQEIQGPILAELAELGISPSYVSPIAPLIYVNVSKSAALLLAERSDIDMMYEPNKNQNYLATAKPTQKADVVDGWGFDGTGIDVGILESGRVIFDNPDLNAGTTRVPADNSVSHDHATNVGGIVASQNATNQGIAQGVDLFSANATSYDDDDLAAAMDWAASTQDVDVINNSWGGCDGTGLNDHARHLDYIVRYLRSTVVAATGNNNCGNHIVGNPARGYNLISVGNYEDSGSLTWTGDIMRSTSSYVNPDTGVEKPEVSASGTSITSTGPSGPPWNSTTMSGTSQASPMVSGEAALIMDVNSAFEIRPELVKAIIMASALHNIDGDSRLSDKDGAGGVDMRAAVVLAQDMPWDFRNVYSTADLPYSLSYYIPAGETVRAVIAWDSNPNSSYTTDPLNADIDLTVYDPSNNFVTTSLTVSNPYEIVQFTASTSGTYKFTIDESGFDGTHEYIAFAAWLGNKGLSNGVSWSLGAPPTVRDYFRFTPGSGSWNVAGLRSASGNDVDMNLYPKSAFGNPEDYDLLTSSAYGSGSIDFVLIDRNHAPSGDYFLEVRNYSGSSNYLIEYGATMGSITTGKYGAYAINNNEVVNVWDASIASGTTHFLSIVPYAGDADFALSLHDSTSGTSSTWYTSRSSYVAFSDIEGAGGRECISYTSSQTDEMALVAANKGLTSNTSFHVYSDTSAPTGSISINSGAATTTSSNVTLSLSASDSQTQIRRMRIRNSGGSWGSWQNYATSLPWTLTAGTGTRTVDVEYENNTCMSKIYSDSISVVVPTYSLTVSKTGTGYGTVTSSPAGINCGSTCSASFNQNTLVTLSATPAAGSSFTGWSGSCSGTGTCQVTMSANKSVSADFTVNTETLTVSKTGTGSGTVTSSPAGIDCGSTCSASFNQNTLVTLSATPAAGSSFAGWGGDCSGTSDCVVTMSEDKSVTAEFTLSSVTKNYRSQGGYDGQILESSEASNKGGSINATATTFILGDDANDRQYRAILSFNTAGLPDNAVITTAVLKIKKQSQVGSNPFTTHQGLKMDIRMPYFGTAVILQASDFQSAGPGVTGGTFGNVPSADWYSATLSSAFKSFINLTGTTQFRLRFLRDDNDDLGADYLNFYSGNSGIAGNRPILIIQYYVP
jgi:hypothetical protein